MGMFQIKRDVENNLAHSQHTLRPSCQLCGLPHRYLHLHHIINRSFITDKKILDEMPLSLHALLCESCHIDGKKGAVDTPEMRAKLLAENAFIYGLDRVLQDIDKLDKMLFNGLNTEIVKKERIVELYDEYKASRTSS